MKANAKAFLFLFVISGVAVGLAFCIRYLNVRKLAEVKKPAPIVSAPQPPTPAPSVPSEPVKPAPEVNVFRSADGVTQVSLPSFPKLPNPFLFYGTSTAFENQIAWSLKDGKGKVITEGSLYVHSPDAGIPGPFSLNGFYDTVPKTATGTLSVFEPSAKDGTPIHVVEIPVQLATSTKSVSVYFGNTKKNPNMLDCQLVYPVKRTAVAGDEDAVALHSLLRGPTALETKAGYVTALPTGMTDPTVHQDGTKFTADFDASLQDGVAGSCRVAAIRAQILMTLMHGHPGAEGAISVNGQTEGILQP